MGPAADERWIRDFLLSVPDLGGDDLLSRLTCTHNVTVSVKSL
jgi:hypothetical protein